MREPRHRFSAPTNQPQEKNDHQNREQPRGDPNTPNDGHGLLVNVLGLTVHLRHKGRCRVSSFCISGFSGFSQRHRDFKISLRVQRRVSEPVLDRRNITLQGRRKSRSQRPRHQPLTVRPPLTVAIDNRAIAPDNTDL